MIPSHSKILRSTSRRGMPIPQLIRIVKPSCGELLLNEVETILVKRENDMKVESEHLMEELRLKSEQVNLLNSILEKRQRNELKLVEELKCRHGKCKEWEEMNERLTEEKRKAIEECEESAKILADITDQVCKLNKKVDEMKGESLQSQGKCKNLQEIVEKLTELQRVSSDREKKALEQYEETMKILSDKVALVLNLNKELHEMKDRSLESDGKCKELEEMVARLTEENRDSSEREKRATSQCEETAMILTEKTTLILNLNKKLEELKCQNLDSQVKSKYWEDMNAKLAEEQRASNDREKKAIKVLEEKTNLVLHLNNSLEEMKAKNSDNQRLLQESQEKILQLETSTAKMEQEIVDMRIGKFMLKERADKSMEELKSKIYEANKTESKLRLKVWESETDAQFDKRKLEDVVRRMMRMEETVLKYFNANLGGIDRNGSNVAGETSGEKVDAAKIFEDSPAQPIYTPHLGSKQAIHDNIKKKPQGSDSNPSKTTPFSVKVEIIHIDDNEDEMKPVEAAAKVCNTSEHSLQKDQMMTVKASPETPSPHQTNQGNDTSYLKDDNAMKWVSGGKRKIGDISVKSSPKSTSHTVGTPCTPETVPPKFHEAEHTGEARPVRLKSMDDVMTPEP